MIVPSNISFEGAIECSIGFSIGYSIECSVQRTMPQHDVSLALARATREVPAAATAVDDSVFSVHFYHELVLVQKRP